MKTIERYYNEKDYAIFDRTGRDSVVGCVCNHTVENRIYGDRVIMPINSPCEDHQRDCMIQTMTEWMQKALPDDELMVVIGFWPKGKWGALVAPDGSLVVD